MVILYPLQRFSYQPFFAYFKKSRYAEKLYISGLSQIAELEHEVGHDKNERVAILFFLTFAIHPGHITGAYLPLFTGCT